MGSVDVSKAALWPVEGWLRRHYGWFTACLLVLVALNELSLFGTNLLQWDWLLVTGFVTFLAALRSALQLPDRMHVTIHRLFDRRILVGTNDQLDEFERELHRVCRRYALVGGPTCAVVLGTAWLVAFPGEIASRLLLLIVEVAAAVLVGFFIGRAYGYGKLGRRLVKRRLTVEVQPEHLDGAGGLRPVGDYYFFQAMLIAIPAAYLGIWALLFPVVGGYDHWRAPYVGLLMFLIMCEIGSFLVPLRSFHQIMKQRKSEWLARADKISHDVSKLQEQLRNSTDDEQSKRLEETLTRLTLQYRAIDTMSTWPLGVRVRRRFAVSNLVLFIPVAGQLLGASESTQQFLDSLQKAVSGQS